ncbi:MAG: tripartite tricarboxylate transporter TctB family protein [Acetobacteraceae bacterium]
MAAGVPRPGGGLFKGPKDIASGLMFIGIGAFGLWVGRDYPMGTALRLGTGVFPAILCWGLIVIGTIVLIQGMLVRGEPIGAWAWRPVLLVGLAATLFALLIEPAGLVVSMLVLMIIGALAGEGHSIREFTIFTLIMIVLSVAMFIYGLDMPIKVFPWS